MDAGEGGGGGGSANPASETYRMSEYFPLEQGAQVTYLYNDGYYRNSTISGTETVAGVEYVQVWSGSEWLVGSSNSNSVSKEVCHEE